MIKIGIIGDIGSGKSYVAKLFNCPIFNADLEVSKIYKKNQICFKKLKKKLPKYIFSFPIKKEEISKAINSNKNNIRKISSIVHPIVRSKMRFFFKKNKKNKIVVLDVPLLLENKLKINNILVFVDAKKSDILKRLKKRPNYNPKLISLLKKFQLPVEIKKKKSNYIIKNNFNSSNVKKNVKLLKIKILNNERSSS
tara:strand:+ start:1545 stop:2132 length:588 start_codon:yes stop_codon:yes gene_type:complete